MAGILSKAAQSGKTLFAETASAEPGKACLPMTFVAAEARVKKFGVSLTTCVREAAATLSARSLMTLEAASSPEAFTTLAYHCSFGWLIAVRPR